MNISNGYRQRKSLEKWLIAKNKGDHQKNDKWLYTKAIFRKMANGYIQRQSLGKLQLTIYKGNLQENGK